jgi:hypothetical protein
MAIKIGTASTLGHPDGWSCIPDYRSTQIKTLDSPYVAVVGDGHKSQGDAYSFSAVFAKADFDTIGGYFDNNTLVDVVMENGTTLSSRRIIIKSWSPVKSFETGYVQASIELWGA